MWGKSLEHVIRSVIPFVGLMLIGLAIVTWFPQVSIGLGNIIMGSKPDTMEEGDEEGEEGEEGEIEDSGGMPTMEEMMRESMEEDGDVDDEETEEPLHDEDEEDEEPLDDDAQEPGAPE
jgi:hypothetical protein